MEDIEKEFSNECQVCFLNWTADKKLDKCGYCLNNPEVSSEKYSMKRMRRVIDVCEFSQVRRFPEILKMMGEFLDGSN